jgi:hypothetical protein
MKRNSLFQRGSGVFKCDGCGRMTRHTGVQSTGSQSCPQCYELAGLQNSLWDGEPIKSLAEERDRLLDAAVKAGGSAEQIKADFSDLFAD